ncbi:MAG: PH domain-containing protein [Actinomycetes bacterium]
MLMPGETIQLEMRPNWKFIFAGLIIGAFTIICWIIVVGFFSDKLGGAGVFVQVAGSLVALVIVIRFTIQPFVQWLVTRYTFTNRRVMSRSGVLRRHAADIPLDKISNVYYDQKILDRIFRCGTLTIDSSGGDGFKLDNVSNVEKVTTDLHVLVEADQRFNNN